jgi:hypothetical protein
VAGKEIREADTGDSASASRSFIRQRESRASAGVII